MKSIRKNYTQASSKLHTLEISITPQQKNYQIKLIVNQGQ